MQFACTPARSALHAKASPVAWARQAGPKIAQLVMDALRKLESDAAIKSNSRLRLDGPIEVDATSVRTFRIGKNSHAFAPEIRDWVSGLHACINVKDLCVSEYEYEIISKHFSQSVFVCHFCWFFFCGDSEDARRKERPSTFSPTSGWPAWCRGATRPSSW